MLLKLNPMQNLESDLTHSKHYSYQNDCEWTLILALAF